MTLFSLSVDDQNDYLKLGLAWEASVLREAIPIVFMNMVRFILLEIKLKSLLKFQLKFIFVGGIATHFIKVHNLNGDPGLFGLKIHICCSWAFFE